MSPPQHLHLIAACGTGMGSLAGMLKARGYHVTGSDQHVYPPMSTQLEAWGIPIATGFRPENLVPRPDLVVVGNVISRGNPEAEAAQQAGIPVLSFPQALAQFFIQERHSVVVTGTHGKSTTTGLIAWLLDHAGLDPTFFVGAVLRNFASTFRLGDGPHVVVEGDEYDSAYFDKGPKFLHYRPRTAVLTSVEFDHADIYRDLDHVRSAFASFVPLLPADGRLVACYDQPHVRALLASASIACPVDTYGLTPEAVWHAATWQPTPQGTHLTVHYHGQLFGHFQSPLFGPHNVHNCLAALAVGHHLGLSAMQMAAGLATFANLKRRCEVRGAVDGITVIDDFAHHPTAVRVTITGMRQAYPQARLWAVFEPRTATSRRAVFQQDYIDALGLADGIIIADVHRKEQLSPEQRFSPEELITALRHQGKAAWFSPSTAGILAHLQQDTRPGDVVLIMSNGGFDNIHERLLQALRERNRGGNT